MASSPSTKQLFSRYATTVHTMHFVLRVWIRCIRARPREIQMAQHLSSSITIILLVSNHDKLNCTS